MKRSVCNKWLTGFLKQHNYIVDEKLKKALLQIEDDTHSLLQDKSAAEERYCHCYTEGWGVKRVEIT
jgi:hypothetical protein